MSTIVLHYIGGPFDGRYERCHHTDFDDGQIIRMEMSSTYYKCNYQYESNGPYDYGETHVGLDLTAVTPK